MRLDMAARSDEVKAKLAAAPDWDLVICDEAHRMAASYFGGEVKETRRHKLGKLLGNADGQPPLDDGDAAQRQGSRFSSFSWGSLTPTASRGVFERASTTADVSDMMRRLTKGGALPLRRHAVVPRTACLHRQL